MAVKINDLKNISNKELAEKYAKPGCIGLVGIDSVIDNAIKKGQKLITKDGKNSSWSHAFIFSGFREDGHLWIIESDLGFHKKQIKLGVQENRAEKYFDEKMCPNYAVLDFDLSKEIQKKIVGEGLNLVADKAEYSIREVFGALFSVTNKSRDKENILAQKNSYFCSAMVQQCYSKANIKLSKNIALKNITPEDISTNENDHTQYRIIR